MKFRIVRQSYVGLVLSVAVMGLTACGDDGTKPASKSDVRHIVEMCAEKLNLGEAGCSCIGDKAMAELTGREARYVAAFVDDDQTVADELRSELTLEEVDKATNFFKTAPSACASAAVMPEQ